MQEAGVLVDFRGNPIYWHLPANRGTVVLPDSRDLWKAFEEKRDRIYGYAHSHPGSGMPAASAEDITSFSAIERGLGRRLVWWIATATDIKHYLWRGPDEYLYRGYADTMVPHGFAWLDELRNLSHYDGR
jgi:hypothetical protein